ncbi:B12-binding domain-containing radical SAM protein [Methanospirillum lacunae]|uniref:Uncharacterized protein n=1 Tax=Methanospirillum lacunae TaxID=668570 RepID=A0A2V2MWU3_9EURY|nr:radical SAM protein [Methanospirillum lacunae]PWR70700.1 hypothetical protein DK846_13905 [Methanospirillum lacunae]
MNVILVSFPRTQEVRNNKETIPVGILYIASYLQKKGHNPIIIDFSILHIPDNISPPEFFADVIEKEIHLKRPGLIGLNCFDSMKFLWVRETAKILYNTYPEIPISTGGLHPTYFAYDILNNCPEISYICLGEGEETMAELASSLQVNDIDNIKKIDALALRERSKIIINSRNFFSLNLDDYGIPLWNLIQLENYYSDHSSYWNPKNQNINLVVPILSSRGCPFSCSFCSVKKFMGGKLRLRSPKLVVDEIELLYNRYRQRYFEFIDDNLTVNRNHVLNICQEILNRGLDIQFSLTNGIYLGNIQEEVVEALSKAGCVMVKLPIEHGNDYIREHVIGKKVSRKNIQEASKLCKKYDIFTFGLFIMGFPEETTSTLEDTIQLMKELKLDMNYVANLIPFPETDLYFRAETGGCLISTYSSNDFWKGDIQFNADNHNEFYIKPYAMSIEDLIKYREKFNSMKYYSERAKRINNIIN